MRRVVPVGLLSTAAPVHNRIQVQCWCQRRIVLLERDRWQDGQLEPLCGRPECYPGTPFVWVAAHSDRTGREIAGSYREGMMRR